MNAGSTYTGTVTKKPLFVIALTVTHSARFVLLFPVMVTLPPVAGVTTTRSDARDQVIGMSLARAGRMVALTVAPADPVRTVGATARLTNGPPPATPPVGGGPETVMRKTS